MGSGDGPDEVGVPRRAADAQGLRRRGLVRVHRDQLDGQQLPSNVVERLQDNPFSQIDPKSRNRCGSDGQSYSDGIMDLVDEASGTPTDYGVGSVPTRNTILRLKKLRLKGRQLLRLLKSSQGLKNR